MRTYDDTSMPTVHEYAMAEFREMLGIPDGQEVRLVEVQPGVVRVRMGGGDDGL